MGVGHAAAALGAAKVAPCVNVGWLVFAALLADFLLGIFAMMGLEHAHVPPDYALRHYLTFTFPYSHGLVPLLLWLWGVIFGLVVSRTQRVDRRRVFLVVAAVVLPISFSTHSCTSPVCRSRERAHRKSASHFGITCRSSSLWRRLWLLPELSFTLGSRARARPPGAAGEFP